MPYLGSAAVRFAACGRSRDAAEKSRRARAARAGSELGRRAPRDDARRPPRLNGRKVAVEHAGAVERLAVVAAAPTGRCSQSSTRAARRASRRGRSRRSTRPRRCTRSTSPTLAVGERGAGAGAATLARLTTIGALLAAAEAVGAAGRLLDDACRYAGERRQFGRTIGSFQALRHLLADMYVRQASSWSSVLYAAAALDEDAGEAPRTASIAKAYVSRAAREVAHGAMQVFGGIAVTAEHPAHRFLRRIVVRERQFGDAAHHERALGRALAAAAVPEPVG